ncbi:MAG: hypothetical protein K5Q68_09205 [Roseococcus sp.]|nr:hypothetical protein [Roseococcus sp.]
MLAGLLLLGGCAELKTPRPPEPPVDLAGRISAAPLPLILDAAARDFDQAGAGLAGRPAATALAAARLEWIAGEFRSGRRLAPLPDSFRFGTQGAVAEARSILGIRPDAPPDAVVAALVTASRALARGDQAAVSTALAAPIFLNEGRPVLSRLRQPGAFPNAALATVAVRDEVSRLVAEGRTSGLQVFDTPEIGLSSTGLGPGTGF